MKPVAAGAVTTPEGLRNQDALDLIAQSGLDLPYATVNPFVYGPAIAPHVAATQAGAAIRFAPLLDAFARICAASDAVVVEGAGGWRVPLGPDGDVADLAGLPRQPRLVGYALHAAPEGARLPWQRVVNAQRGRLSLGRGVAGGELPQRFRLDREGVVFDPSGRIPLDTYRWKRPPRRPPKRPE